MDLDRQFRTRIGHTGMLSWNPVPLETLEEWCGGLPLGSESRILDVGCGRAELLHRLAARFGCRGLGVDPDREALALAREAAERLGTGDRVALIEAPFRPEVVTDASQDLALCLGSTQAFDGLETALWVLRERVRPGGHLLIGEGFWRREPAPEYLELLGCEVGDLHSHLVNLRLAEEAGLEVARAREATDEEWREYEDRVHANLIRWCDEHADDPRAADLRGHTERWRRGWEIHGRTTLGFGLYLLRRPSA
ncbi:MAG: class I SAM-dependent methyltransferase [Planctomycetota bacterium]|nr:MAG: class I SAM-dependent methyltransferase [Planctomycetota bacterium]